MCSHSESRRNIRCSEYHLEEPPVLRLLRHIIIEYAAILYHAFRGCDFQRTRSNTTPAQVSTSTITVRLQPLVGGHDVTSSFSSQTTSKLLELLQILRTLIDEEISKRDIETCPCIQNTPILHCVDIALMHYKKPKHTPFRVLAYLIRWCIYSWLSRNKEVVFQRSDKK